ncbi:hypothetical protein CYQ88_04545 [Hydrogenovibrio sp. SC-1]|uniref:PcfJ domain-containing protein n=1 Tax=Hydrogenovibrio sp. SC-1 TaxID=2065820 RepID=UPI000C7C284C|nr:PcfJ domain-containing protein [Hydrogenovibrio sp. SC-1]PLA74866.1 hypothetical protein CYQ88_04545 [Hydrogenovibrio sp. SC-1]
MQSSHLVQHKMPQQYNDSIIINIGQILGDNSQIEITPWNQGVSWLLRERQDHKYEYGIWEIPGFSIGYMEKAANDSGNQFSIPDDVKEAINQFEKHYENHSSTALWFVSRSIEAKELLIDAPFIFWCVLEYAKRQDLEVDEIFVLFGSKRKTILNKMGFEGTKSQIKALKHIQFSYSFQYDYVPKLIQFFQTATPQQLASFEYLDFDIVKAINQNPELLKSKWIYHLNAKLSSNIRSIVSLHQDTLGLLDALLETRRKNRVFGCATIEALKELHDTLVVRLNDKKFQEAEQRIFPDSPFEDTPSIRYITNAKMLHEEGQIQKHCVYLYEQRILRGEYLVYQCIGEERATVGIRFDNGKNRFVIEQIKGCRNHAVSDEVEEEIQAWFYEQNKFKPKPQLIIHD